MRRALELARQGAQAGEVPVGAVLVLEGDICGEGFNSCISYSDPTAHAEIVAIRQACVQQNNYRIPGSTLYVTLEPCLMCVGAIVHARVERLVYGVNEPKAGAIESRLQGFAQPHLNHVVEVGPRVLENECKTLIQRFFQERRSLADDSE